MKERFDLYTENPSIWLQEGSFWCVGAMLPVTVAREGSAIVFSSPQDKPLRADGRAEEVEPGHYELHISLKNTDDAPIDTKFSYPYILYRLGDTDVRVLDPTFGGVLDRIGWPLAVTYPGRASFCLTASATADQAVACGLYNKEQYITLIRNCSGNDEGHMRFTIEKLTVRPGETLELPVMYIRRGNHWADVLTPYKKYLETAFPPINDRPEWINGERYTESRSGHSLAPYNLPEKGAGVIIFSELSKKRTYEQIKAEVDSAIDHGIANGYKPLFYQFGWWRNLTRMRGEYLFDSFCGDYTEATETARNIVKYIHSRGCRTYLYTNATAAGDETQVFRSNPGLFCKNADGFPTYNGLLPMYLFCPAAPGIRAYWDSVLEFMLLDMNADGVFLDQIACAEPPALCYDPAHRHENTYTYGKDMLELIKYIRRKAKELKPDACVMGELVLDSRSVLLDESHGYGYSSIHTTPPEDLEQLRNRAPSEYYVFTRFLSPRIYTQIGRKEPAVMNGAKGHFETDLWKENHEIFESGVEPCRTSPSGALAYLFGKESGRRILAVRADGDIGRVEITLPDGVELVGDAPDGLQFLGAGRVACEAMTVVKFYCINITAIV